MTLRTHIVASFIMSWKIFYYDRLLILNFLDRKLTFTVYLQALTSLFCHNNFSCSCSGMNFFWIIMWLHLNNLLHCLAVSCNEYSSTYPADLSSHIVRGDFLWRWRYLITAVYWILSKILLPSGLVVLSPIQWHL